MARGRESGIFLPASKRDLPRESESLIQSIYWLVLMEIRWCWALCDSTKIAESDHNSWVRYSSRHTHAITSLIARKGSYPTKECLVSRFDNRVMNIQIPSEEYKNTIRLLKEAFRIDI